MNQNTYDPVNKARAFPETGLFMKKPVMELMSKQKPIIKVWANVDGKEVGIALYWKMEWDDAAGAYSQTKFKLDKNGNKYLHCGKVEFVEQKPVVDNSWDKPHDEGSDGLDDDDIGF